MTIDAIKQKVKAKQPAADMTLLDLAYDYARQAHAGQVRLSGEDYLEHSLRTTATLAEWGLDMPTVVAGLLHDVPEDTEKSIEDVQREFGPEIGSLVAGITKLGKLKYRGYHRYAENLRKMFVAMAADARVVFIKFADRIDNLGTLAALPLVKQQRVAKESLEIYAPIAHRLGMGFIKGELEDLSFAFAYPVAYQWVSQLALGHVREQQQRVERYRRATRKLLESNGIASFQLDGRVKRKYSLYRKLLRPEYRKDINQIYDLVALRIVVPSIRDCYHVLGLVNNKWPPLPHRIRDYISRPKPNGYQSLHTIVFSNGGLPVEFQIRTKQMHDFAEFGMAAHWHFKELPQNGKTLKQHKGWLEQLAKWQQEITADSELVKKLKIDAFEDRIFVFTPKGDVIDLPEGATPIDFAYHVHSDIGDKCGGAKVNSKLAAFDKPLKSGDVVEIMVNKQRPGPASDWLQLVKTPTARDKIKAALRRQNLSLIDRLLKR